MNEHGYKLVAALRRAGLDKLAERVEMGEFHGDDSPHDLPALALDVELVAVIELLKDVRERFVRRSKFGGDGAGTVLS
jgi:hypothetical protein